VEPLGASADGESLRVFQLYGNVLLCDAREFAMKFVGIIHFPNIESRLPGANGGCGRIATFYVGNCVVIEHSQQRGDLVKTTEERHVELD
jgi:hypothetical protein